MPCDTRLKRNQTIQQRKDEVKRATAKLDRLLASRNVTVKVDKKTGAVAFANWADSDRDGVTDACAYRRIMATGSVTAKLAIAKAEQLAGRNVDRQSVAQGIHSHDGGKTWHHGH